ncbi:aldehyde dehydrogenase family protein [Paracoccus sp. S-4012]|uniref:aldehyde dehydrogenase family protein n=1 Tax=Paracoccus sp. S-4012 TaxID=2665648 RepID=UPI001E5D39AD|nr:aldehyde dehydrogenase family protein [Paracoccus sp. S-4012]
MDGPCTARRDHGDAGVPEGAVALALGDPELISARLISAPEIRRLTFTGSVPIGKRLAAQAGATMKPATMELGGRNPVVVFDDAHPEAAAALAVTAKFRNAGQICTSPTRFFMPRALALLSRMKPEDEPEMERQFHGAMYVARDFTGDRTTL